MMRQNPTNAFTRLKQQAGERRDPYVAAPGQYDAVEGQYAPGAAERAARFDDSALNEQTPHKHGYAAGPQDVHWPRGGPDAKPKRLSMVALKQRASA